MMEPDIVDRLLNVDGSCWELCAEAAAEIERLRADLLACSTRLAACAEVLGRAAERGKVCAKCKGGIA